MGANLIIIIIFAGRSSVITLVSIFFHLPDGVVIVTFIL